MKKFLFLAFFALISFATFGQRPTPLRSDSNKSLIDTVANAGPAKTQSSGKIDDAFSSVGVQVTATRINGTTSTGVIRLFASIDGINYARILPTDSLVVNTTTSVTKLFKVTASEKDWPWAYIRAVFTPSGTHTTRFSTIALLKK